MDAHEQQTLNHAMGRLEGQLDGIARAQTLQQTAFSEHTVNDASNFRDMERKADERAAEVAEKLDETSDKMNAKMDGMTAMLRKEIAAIAEQDLAKSRAANEKHEAYERLRFAAIAGLGGTLLGGTVITILGALLKHWGIA